MNRSTTTALLNTSILLLLLFSACKSSKESPEIATTFENKPKIVFLTYTIYKDQSENRSLRLVSKAIVDGELKPQSTSKHDLKEGDLKCEQINSKMTALDELFLDNPLRQAIEYQNSNSEFEKKMVEQDSAQFFFRMQLLPDAVSVRISEFKKVSESYEVLLTTQIN